MLVIQNRKIKRGIEIPEIVPVVGAGEVNVTFPAIDKVKYADFLALQPTPTAFAIFDDSSLVVMPYLGEELILSNEAFTVYHFGISLYYGAI